MPCIRRALACRRGLHFRALDGLDARLSASAVETYETCPLQFKFEREWKLSRQIHARLQYGAAMHRVLRTYYDSVRLGRAKTDEELLRLFTDDLGASGIQDDYQLSLYLEQGLEQLKEFLAGARSAPAIEVLHTEEWFDVEIGGSKLTGESTELTARPMAAWLWSTTRPAKRAPRKMPTTACNFPSTPWRRKRSGVIG